MCNRAIYIILVISCFFSSAHANLPNDFKNLLDRYNFDESSFGFAIQNLSREDASLVKYNEERLFNTASLVKIFSTFIALRDLGPNYKWQSSFYHNGKIEENSLNGDLIFVGGADASFSISNLEQMVRDLQSNGIKKINGDLILDYSFFGEMPSIKDFDNNPLRAYNVLPNAISLQSNTINFKFLIEKNKIIIISDPNLESLSIHNNLRLSNGKCGNWKSRLTASVNQNDKKNSIKFLGGLSKRCKDKEIDLGVLDHSFYFYEVFKQLWIKNGGIFEGGYQKNYDEITNKEYLTSHSSRPLSELIRDVNKYSLNLMARNLMLTTIRENNSLKPTEDMVNIFLNEWLKKEGLSHEGLYVDNGAGLSRNIKISVNQLLLVLQKIYNDPFMPEMIASFPIASIDGTLKNKMKSTKITRNGHFKTGSLKNVVGIAGFFLNEHKDMNAFVFVMNHEDAKNAQPFIRDLLDLSFFNQ